MKRATTEWVRKADDDWSLAQIARRSKKPLHDGLCFHCQQCAEKYLKGLLEELGLAIAKTHDLEDLVDQLKPHHPSLRALRRGGSFLTQFAATTRYPGENAKKRQADAAFRWAGRIRTACRKLLGL
jgi:HEPN domain-containing protein